MKHAWTGGQYSLWRAALATVLCVRFVGLACAGRAMLSLLGAREPMSTAVASACAAAATIACLLLAAGAWHRVAALALAAAVVLVRDPVDSVAEPIILAALLVLVACTRPAPYLSLPAIGRADPSGSWILPDWVYACAWILLAAVLANDLWPVVSAGVWPDGAPESADVAWRWLGWVAYLAPLALPRRATRLAWIAIVAVEIWLIARGASTTARASDVVLLAGATFDPGWIAPRDAHAVEFVYYDGHCGLCHRFVRFLLAEDRRGRAFRFAPLDSESLRRRIAPDARATLPDSVVVCTHDG